MRLTWVDVLLAGAMVVVVVVAVTAMMGMLSTGTAQATLPADIVYSRVGLP